MIFRAPLCGDRVEVRPLVESDREALYAVASDPLLWEQHPQRFRYQRSVFDALFDKLLGLESPMLVTDQKSKRVIGSSSYYQYSPSENSAYIGYTFLARDCWGHTYNKELKALMIEQALRVADTIYFSIGAQNLRSQAAIKKIKAVHCRNETGESGESLIFKIQKDYVSI